jgi:hypothetical protein
MSNDFLDTVGTPEYFCEHLVKVEQIGSCRRLILVTTRDGIRIPVITLVFPVENLMTVIETLRAAMSPPENRSTLLSMPTGMSAH